MLSAILICTIYVLLLLGLAKLFGVKYTDIIKNTDNIKRGIVFPIGIASYLLLIFAVYYGWLPDVLSFDPRVTNPILLLIPFATIVSIVARFSKMKLNSFDRTGIILLVMGTLIIGFSEELLVRGIAVHALQKDGYSIVVIGILSSLIFGLLHFMNFFNGQDIKKTTIQVGGTILMGLNFYIILVITGTLWAPIVVHFLYDLSIFALGPDPKLEKSLTSNIISISTIAMFILPVLGLFFIN